MKRKRVLIRNRILANFLVLFLLLTTLPFSVFADINGYPNEMQTSMDSEWNFQGSIRYWENMQALAANKDLKNTYTITSNNPLGDYGKFSRSDFMYEANWYASIDGSDYKQNKVMLMRPVGQGDLSRTFVPNESISAWGKKLNGNPDYVVKKAPSLFSIIQGNGSGKLVNRIYTRDLAQLAGARVTGTVGLGIFSDKARTQLAYVNFKTTKFPDAKITGPATGKSNTNIPFKLYGKEYFPNDNYKKNPVEINYRYYVNGTQIKTSKVKGAKIYNETFTLNKPAGTYKIKLEIWDQVERKTTTEHTVVINDAPIKPPQYCDVEIVPTGQGSSMNQAQEKPSPNGSISSDSGEYNVVQGIPSSEYNRVDATSQEYLFNQSFIQQLGKVVYNVPVKKTFKLTWKESYECGTADKPKQCERPMTDTETVETTIQVERPYSYWEINRLDIWQWMDAFFTNYSLPGESATAPYQKDLQHDEWHSTDPEDHVFPAPCVNITLPEKTIDGGKSKPSVPSIDSEAKAEAEKQTKDPEVKNDKFEFKNQTIMSDATVTKNGPTPSNIPTPPTVSVEELHLYIDAEKTNYYQSPSTGVANYSSIVDVEGVGGDLAFDFSVNPVTVHTPVTTYAHESDAKGQDQRTDPPRRSYLTYDNYASANPNTERHAFILDEPFKVSIPTNGTHRPIPGYGDKDYAKYVDSKYVKFPFDTFAMSQYNVPSIEKYYKANTWIEVPVDQLTAEFFLPVWVPEGTYNVEFKTIAINAPSKDPNAADNVNGSQSEANTTIPNPNYTIGAGGSNTAAHTSIDTIKTDVVGRLYDLHVTDVTDYKFQDVFRARAGLSFHSGNTYWVGNKDINGKVRIDTNKQTADLLTLPIGPNSHPKIKNIVPKTGYTFKFDLKTKGDFFSTQDGVLIKPTFFYVTKDGKKRTEVDLYYHTNEQKYIKIGSADDKTNRSIIWNDDMRNIHNDQFITNSIVYFTNSDDFDFNVENVSDTTFFNMYRNRYTRTEKVNTGPYGWQALTWKLRGFMGPIPTGGRTKDLMIRKAYETDFEEGITTYSDLRPPLFQGTDRPSTLSQIYSVADVVGGTEQQWYGEYSIPANATPVPKGFNLAEYGRINTLSDSWVHKDFGEGDGYMVVNFDIQTLRNRSETDSWNLEYINSFYKEANQWQKEGFAPSFKNAGNNTFTNKDGDVIYYKANESSLDDFNNSVTH